MARVTDLPPEMIESILWSLDSVRSLDAALRSCRLFYAFAQQGEEMAIGILRRKISPAVWPYVAALDASWICHEIPDAFLYIIRSFPEELDARLDESDEYHSESESHLQDFEEPLDDTEESPDAAEEHSDDFEADRFLATRKLLEMLYDRPSVLIDRILSSVTIFDLHVMERRYDKFNAIATKFAQCAWFRLHANDGSLPQEVTLSSSEHDRILRAIYRLDIFYVLYKIIESHGDVYDLFFFRHSPWENEQMACIYHFLEMRFKEATHDVFAHDVGFGKRKVDYLTLWTDNRSRQLWLSQGIEYICDVTTQHDYESKKRKLETANDIFDAHFPDILCGFEPHLFSLETWRQGLRVTFLDNNSIILTKEEVLSRVLREEDRDHDLGPRESWIAANVAC
ncbi:hypothetical protein CGCSCA1_v007240 [Colletotrichum siamense]|nr:hypothetical protein CGCSCA1_v007240 [Colletotrichum siamense]